MDVFIARQPIYRKNKQVEAYELLYRSNSRNAFDPSVDGEKATYTVISEALLNFGMETLTGMRKAFVNCTEELLLDGFPMVMDPSLFAIEVLENVELTPKVQECLQKYRSRGFLIALDDYDGKRLEKEALACFDMIKIDFRITDAETRKKIVKRMKRAGKIILAEKIETKEDYCEAVKLGCEMFQGYYFSKPVMLKKQKKDVARVTAARLLRRLSDDGLDMGELASIIRVDAHLTYKLLHKMRTLYYYRGNAVPSVRYALVRMGIDEIRRWMILVLVQEMTGEESEEVVRAALIRAVLCESLAANDKRPRLAKDAFITGMFSIIDREDEALPKLLGELDLNEQVCKALLGEENQLNHYLSVALLYEAGAWQELEECAAGNEIDVLPQLYRDAVIYANEVLTEV